MAISERLKAEAKRTIDGMQRFYDKFSDDIDDAEELEHRIARVEASLEGCNGLSQADKIQKTAENVFELTCAQERSYDSLRCEMKRNRDEYRREFSEMKSINEKNFSSLKNDLRKGLDEVMKKIEDSGIDSSASKCKTADDAPPSTKDKNVPMLWMIISNHPMLAFNAFMFILLLVFISGHFEMIAKLLGGPS